MDVAVLRYVYLQRQVTGSQLEFGRPMLNYSAVEQSSLVAQRLKPLPAMQETQVWSLGREDPLEKEIVTHSSILAWRIPWMEKPGRLQSTGSQRVRHDWAISVTQGKRNKWVSEAAQSCPTLCDPMYCSLPGFSIHGILQARILEWVTISFSRASSRPRDQTWVSRIGGRLFNLWATGKDKSRVFALQREPSTKQKDNVQNGRTYLKMKWPTRS